MANIEVEIKEIEKFEQEKGKKFDYIKFVIVNLHGVSKSTVVSRKALEKHLKPGFTYFSGFFAWDIKGFSIPVKELVENSFGNCLMVPVKNTLHVLPWSSKSGNNPRLVGGIFCEAKWLSPYKDGAFLEACTRNLLRRVLTRVEEMGYWVKTAFEIEFTLFKADTLKPVCDTNSLHIMPSIQELFLDIMDLCQEAGVDVTGYQVEDMSSEFEMNMEPARGIKTGDDVMVVKQAIKEIFSSKGYLASFMTSPMQEMARHGFHLNLSLWESAKDGQDTNAFYDPKNVDKMSEVFKHFLAGLLEHSKALTALFCPTVNCYRRLGCRLSPSEIDWNFEDRTASYRVKSTESSCYLENRVPSSSCNVYLATAAMLVAGMDGITKKTVLPEPTKDIHDKILSGQLKLKKKGYEKKKYFPESLDEALVELENNEVLKAGLGRELVEWFVEIKRKGECDVINSESEENKWNLERELYLHYF